MNARRMICALLALCLLAMGGTALAEGRLKEAQMIYEDYDGNRAEQTVADDGELAELEAMLLRAAKHPAELAGNTMNSTLLCTLADGELYDFAVATDGSPYITDMTTDKSYQLEDADHDRFWQIFDLVQEVMGYDAAVFFN